MDIETCYSYLTIPVGRQIGSGGGGGSFFARDILSGVVASPGADKVLSPTTTPHVLVLGNTTYIWLSVPSSQWDTARGDPTVSFSRGPPYGAVASPGTNTDIFASVLLVLLILLYQGLGCRRRIMVSGAVSPGGMGRGWSTFKIFIRGPLYWSMATSWDHFLLIQKPISLSLVAAGRLYYSPL